MTMITEKKIEITSSSQEGLKKAVADGVQHAHKDIGKVRSAEVSKIVAIVGDNGDVVDWKISMIISYK